MIGSKSDQRTLCMSYYELLLIGGLKPSMFLRNFETKHNDDEYKPVEVFQDEYKEKGNQETVAPCSYKQLQYEHSRSCLLYSFSK